jgi:hypothetical protein
MATSPTRPVDAVPDLPAQDRRRAVDLTLTSLRAVVSPGQLTRYRSLFGSGSFCAHRPTRRLERLL